VFHHPLIRTVAYDSQLKSDRAELHRRLAAAIEVREPQSVDQNAALIAEHLEAPVICTPPTAGTCAPQRGPPTAISLLRDKAGSAPQGLPTHYPPMTQTEQPCASSRALCCAGSPFVPI
jgi:adenylate cyclase